MKTVLNLVKLLLPLGAALVCSCGISFSPLPKVTAGALKPGMPHGYPGTLTIFDDDLASGGSLSAWPPTCMVKAVENESSRGEASLMIDLDPNDWSSGGIGWGADGIDLSSVYRTGALQFWVKGADGNEVGTLGLGDNAESGNQCGVSVKVAYFGISTEWQLVTIPLSRFGTRGSWWDMSARTERPCEFNWAAVRRIRFSTPMGGNRRFRIWIDDMRILATTPGKERRLAREREENVAFVIFDDDLPAGTTNSGWPMSCVIMARDGVGYDSTTGMQVDMAVDDWANSSIRWPDPVDLLPYYETGSLRFRIRGSMGREEASLSLGALGPDGKMIAKSVRLPQYVALTTHWQTVTIPFTAFGKKGSYWDEARKIDVEHDLDWSNIVRLGFSTAPEVNRQFRIWLDDVHLLKTTPATVVVTALHSWDEGPRFVPGVHFEEESSTVIGTYYHGEPGPAVRCGGIGHRTHPRFFRSNVDQTYGLVRYHHVLGGFFDRRGGSIFLTDSSLDLSKLVANGVGARLEFRARSHEAISLSVGLVDASATLTSKALDVVDLGGVGVEWKRFSVPLSAFAARGSSQGVAFILAPEASHSSDAPVVVYFDGIVVVKDEE